MLNVYLLNNQYMYIRDGGEQHSEEYKKVNPLEQVPALVVNESESSHFIEICLVSFSVLCSCLDLTLTQSVAIMEYIHDMRPDSRLLPASVEDRAKVRMVTDSRLGDSASPGDRDDHET